MANCQHKFLLIELQEAVAGMKMATQLMAHDPTKGDAADNSQHIARNQKHERDYKKALARLAALEAWEDPLTATETLKQRYGTGASRWSTEAAIAGSGRRFARKNLARLRARQMLSIQPIEILKKIDDR
ncbi:MAG: hypothetical protein AAGA68_13805 [Pseudomonadota bacterium]